MYRVCTVRFFKIDAAIRNAFPKCVCAQLHRKPEGFFRKSEGFFRESESFFWRIGQRISFQIRTAHKFPKRGAASLTYLPRSRLDLLRSRLGLPRLRLSRNSGPATEGFSNRGINFKDAYRIYYYFSISFCVCPSWQSGNIRQWSNQELLYIGDVIQAILFSMQDVLAHSAFRCQSYTRSLMYLETYLMTNPDAVQRNLGFLQVCYTVKNWLMPNQHRI